MIEFALTKTLHGASGPLVLDAQACIADGSTVALHAPSGAGKTTLLRLLAGLSAPDSGRIVVAGESESSRSRMRGLMTSQAPMFFGSSCSQITSARLG